MFAPKITKPQTSAAAQPIRRPAPQPLGQFRPLEPRPVTAGATPGVSWDFGQIPLFPPDRANRLQAPFSFEAPPLPIAIQPKLIVGQTNDPREYEADRVADQVIRMPDSAVSLRAIPPQIGRTSAARAETDQGRPMLQAKHAATGGTMAPRLVQAVLCSPGNPLPQATRSFFEPRFGYDFSQVRVHTDDRAARSAADVGAAAYASGGHIAFAQSQYVPAPPPGAALSPMNWRMWCSRRMGTTARCSAPARNRTSGQHLQRGALKRAG